ncbi:uncharacterized protein LOC132639448 [Lycium barbarum]|uniref:uncharacterized protein LOC132639448 n=1 Tax=Lycium barbarum TaxID=112863 RepID=UPI00293E08C7|nr:uncharacterized protein LOC132639448 [Lycium barbarum]
MRFGRKEELCPRFIIPYEIVRRIGKVDYGLTLPSEMSMLHPVFYISLLRQYKPNPSHILTHEEIKVKQEFSYEEEPVQISDRQVRRLRTKDVAFVNVLWQNHNTGEETWEVEEEMKKIYTHLFPILVSDVAIRHIAQPTMTVEEQKRWDKFEKIKPPQYDGHPYYAL